MFRSRARIQRWASKTPDSTFALSLGLRARAGITAALITLAMALVGRLRGGLGHVNVLTSVFFAEPAKGTMPRIASE